MPCFSAVTTKLKAVVSIAALALAVVNAQPLHANLDYHRYLQVKDEMREAAAKYLAGQYGQTAILKGIWEHNATQEERDGDLQPTEEETQRFFMAHQLVQKLQAAHPDATFSTESPFTLLTSDEFQEYVGLASARPKGAVEGVVIVGARAPSARRTRLLQLQHAGTVHATDLFDSNVSTAAVDQVVLGGDNGNVNWNSKGCVTPARHQGQCGSCWAFASVAALESAICIKNGVSKDKMPLLSEQMVTSCDTEMLGCNGGATDYAINWIKGQGGVCTLESYPYTGAGKDKCKKDCKKVDIKIKRAVAVSKGEDNLAEAVRKQPVMVGVAAGGDTWKQYKSGVLSSCPGEIDHSVLVYGFTDDAWLVKNSWGAQWGDEGMLKIKRTKGNGIGMCQIASEGVYPELE
ncbi:TPA: hypothetical protein N0F65_003221 [Lagenidium giganteum]|uniref:Peptidase C1A papain C-terminal domain-containing protein n=1 Tax=Lagenidium giganteum TaxID=4803 RepID=A0AAV2ZCX3_9STRA|nr:TPA: hypothetical protein N0F65_003221 [Lagenidium giganteum]